MLSYHVALVSETNSISASDLNVVAAALQKQVTRDFGPIWGVDANVSAFSSLEDVPTDYWPVIVQDDINTPGAAGVHEDQNGQPFALVQYSDAWSLTASHETLEMLADPFGKRVVAGASPKPGQGRVNFLVEVCDPSEDQKFAYTVNGVVVSDFYTPNFFDPVTNAGVRYSFQGAITKPRTVLKGGYLSWGIPATNEWWQMQWFNGSKPAFNSLGIFNSQGGQSLRSWVDANTPTPLEQAGLDRKYKTAAALKEICRNVETASEGRAAQLRHVIDKIKRGK